MRSKGIVKVKPKKLYKRVDISNRKIYLDMFEEVIRSWSDEQYLVNAELEAQGKEFLTPSQIDEITQSMYIWTQLEWFIK